MASARMRCSSTAQHAYQCFLFLKNYLLRLALSDWHLVDSARLPLSAPYTFDVLLAFAFPFLLIAPRVIHMALSLKKHC
jgi:hypothetical protein